MPPTLNFQKYSPMLKDSNEKKNKKNWVYQGSDH